MIIPNGIFIGIKVFHKTSGVGIFKGFYCNYPYWHLLNIVMVY